MESVQLAPLGLVVARLSGVLIASPFWGNRALSMRMRIAVCVMLAFCFAPFVTEQANLDFANRLDYLVAAIGELFQGALFGLAVHIVFKSMLMAGELIGVPLGLRGQSAGRESSAVGSSLNEADSSTGKLFDVTAMAIFILVGGPSLLIAGVFDSFQSQPVGHGWMNEASLESLMAIVPASFLIGLKIAFPIVVCQWIALLVVGIVSRTLPQVSTFQVGLPLAVSATWIASLFSIGTIALIYGQQIEAFTENVFTEWREPVSSDSMPTIREVAHG